MNLLFLLFLILIVSPVVFSKGGGVGGGRGGGFGGGRGGGFGGGRGFSGARASVARGAISSRSSFSGGIRSGFSGTKVGSSSSLTSYGSSSFRSAAFHSPLYFHPPIIVGHPYVIASGNPPIPYDSRTYHWTAASAKQSFSGSDKYYMLCQYDFGSDDEQLQNVTFANGTKATSLFFGCDQDIDNLSCCGMYCCQQTWTFEELFWLVFFLIILGIFSFMLVVLECRARNQQRAEQNQRQPVPTTEMKQFSNIRPSGKVTNLGQ